jgi:hypothetical protein
VTAGFSAADVRSVPEYRQPLRFNARLRPCGEGTPNAA